MHPVLNRYRQVTRQYYKNDCILAVSGILQETIIAARRGGTHLGRLKTGLKGMVVAYLLKEGKKRLLPIIMRKLKSR
jgi:hypothetical protein